MTDQYYHDRLKHLQAIAALGIDPYGARFADVTANADVRARVESLGIAPGQSDENSKARVAGRVHLRRVMGKLAFITVRDSTADLQIGISKARVGEGAWSLL